MSKISRQSRSAGFSLLAVAAATLLFGTGANAVEIDDEGLSHRTQTTDNTYALDAFRQRSNDSTAPRSATSTSQSPPTEYIRFPACNRPNYDPNVSPLCTGEVAIAQTCPDGSNARDPLYARTQLADGSWSRWAMISWYQCADNTDALLAAIEHEWTTLAPTPTSATLQPNTDWVYANVPTIAMADDATVTHAATLLGANVQIRATPANFTWAWGDGDKTVTDDPGKPYPHQTLTHTYAHQDGDVTVILATTWNGEYRINNGQWVSFGTTIDSQSPPITVEIRNPRSQLVACDTYGTCR